MPTKSQLKWACLPGAAYTSSRAYSQYLLFFNLLRLLLGLRGKLKARDTLLCTLFISRVVIQSIGVASYSTQRELRSTCIVIHTRTMYHLLCTDSRQCFLSIALSPTVLMPSSLSSWSEEGQWKLLSLPNVDGLLLYDIGAGTGPAGPAGPAMD